MVTEPTAPADAHTRDTADTVIELRSIVVRFGGLMALGGVDLDVARGERLAILGPNGAGKTTLFNVLAGDLVPTEGTVRIKGRDCTSLPSRHRPSLGVARTYQRARSFPGLTVADNLYLAVVGRWGRHRSLWRSGTDRTRREQAVAVAETVWLGDRLESVVADLSHGQKRQLEIGMALATEPDVLLADEPASGLSRGERERLIDLLNGLDDQATLLLIEHDMDVAFEVARRVFVMSDGLAVTAGTPEEVQADPVVQKIYLGSEAAA